MRFGKLSRAWITDPGVQNWAVIALTFFVFIGIALFYLFPAIRQATQNAADLQLEVASHAQDLLALDLQFTFADLSQMGRNALSSGAGEGTRPLVLPHDPRFISLIMLDPSGRVIASDSSTNKSSEDYRSALFFTKALSGTSYVSPVYLSPSGPLIRVSIPIMQGNSVQAVISAEFDVGLLWNVVQLATIPAGKVYIVDTNGSLIADQNQARSRSGENLSYRTIVSDLEGGQNRVSLIPYINEDRVAVVASGIRMPETQWGVIVEQDANQAFQQRTDTTRLAIEFFLVAIGLLFMLALGSFRLTRLNRQLLRDLNIIEAERKTSQQVIGGVRDSVIALDRDRKIITFNHAAETLIGQSAGMVMGASIESIFTLYDNYEVIPVDRYCPPGAHGSSFERHDVRMVIPKGEVFVDIVSGSIGIGEGTSIGYVLTIHNVTEDRRLEKRKADFVAVAAHQLRTPLTGIKWAFNLLLDGTLGTFTKEQEETLARASITTDAMIRIVNDMLDVDLLEADSLKLNRERVPLTRLVSNIVHTFEIAASAKHVSLLFQRHGEYIVNIDAHKTATAIGNLVDNAIKYTPEGGTVQIGLHRSSHDVIVSVKDSGIGIPAEEQPEIFRRFFRASNATRQVTTGSGLGLFLVKGIVDEQGGKLWFESELGKGTTFFISFPTVEHKTT